MRRRSPGVVGFRKSFDGLVVETSLRFQAAVPASNQPALSPTRGSGFGFVAPTLMFGVGAELADEVDEVDAHAVATSATQASPAVRRFRCLTGSWGTGDQGVGTRRRLTTRLHRLQHQGHAI